MPLRVNLYGSAFLQGNHHKNYAYALQTTRGISNGSEHFGMRSIRSDRFKLIFNLTPETRFQNNLTENKGGWIKTIGLNREADN